MKKLLVDLASAISLDLRLTESSGSGKGKFVFAKGEFGRADVPTQNRRVYPKKLWEREIQRIKESIAARKVLGELDHPADGRTSLKRVSHIITALDILPDGQVIGEAQILDNEHGRQLRSILEAGGAVGVSSRGMGSTSPGDDGIEVVQDDFSYMTHDFVVDPAVITSYPKFVSEVRWIEPSVVIAEAPKLEGVEMAKTTKTDTAKTVVENEVKEAVVVDTAIKPVEKKEELEEKKKEEENPAEVIKTIEGEEGKEIKVIKVSHPSHQCMVGVHLANPSDKDLEDAIELAKKDGMDCIIVHGEMKSDESPAPEVPAEEPKPEVQPEQVAEEAKKIEEAAKEEKSVIKVEEFEKIVSENASLKSELEKMTKLSDRLGIKLFIAESLEGFSLEERGEISALIGNTDDYETLKELEEAVDVAKNVIAKRKQIEEAAKKELEELKAQLEESKKQAEELKKVLDEQLSARQKDAVKVYVESRIASHPNASKIRSLCEGKSKEEADEIIKLQTVKPVISEDFAAIRRRFSQLRGSKIVEKQLDTSEKKVTKSAVLSEGVDSEIAEVTPGVSLEEVKHL